MPATSALLEQLTGTVTRDASFANPDVWVSTHSANPGATGANELTSGTGAAGRQNPTFANGGAGSDPSSSQVSIAVPGAQTIKWYGLWTARTGGTFLQGIPAVTGQALMATALNASSTIDCPGHGLTANTPVRLYTAPNAKSGVPVGLTSDTVFFVLTVLTADTFTLSATLGGTVITPGSSAGFFVYADATIVFTTAGTLVINAGNLIYETVS